MNDTATLERPSAKADARSEHFDVLMVPAYPPSAPLMSAIAFANCSYRTLSAIASGLEWSRRSRALQPPQWRRRRLAQIVR